MKKCKECGREEWGFLSALNEDGYCPRCAQTHNAEKVKELKQQIKRLQEQLKEANDVIISVAVMPRFPVNPELCREYLEKWGVK